MRREDIQMLRDIQKNAELGMKAVDIQTVTEIFRASQSGGRQAACRASGTGAQQCR